MNLQNLQERLNTAAIRIVRDSVESIPQNATAHNEFAEWSVEDYAALDAAIAEIVDSLLTVLAQYREE